MSQKNLDKKGRWRKRIVAFRVSDEEKEQMDIASSLSGLNKQDYYINKCLNRDIVVKPNPRVAKSLRDNLNKVYNELVRIENSNMISDEIIENIHLIARILQGMQEEGNGNSV